MRGASLFAAAFAVVTLATLAAAGGCSMEASATHGDDELDSVVQTARRAGPCDDGLYCTVDDRMVRGECVGRPRSCGSAASYCAAAPTCDEEANACVAGAIDPACENRCQRVRRAAKYRRGWRRGYKRVHKAWAKTRRDCNRAEEFLEEVLAKLGDGDGDGDDPPGMRCRVAGRTDGALNALATLQTECGEQCFLSGEVVGSVAAEAYCELAIAFAGVPDVDHWFRQPVNLCGFLYEAGCDATFLGDTIVYENDAGSCGQYTTGDYALDWEHTRLRACIYDPDTMRSGGE